MPSAKKIITFGKNQDTHGTAGAHANDWNANITTYLDSQVKNT